MDFKDLVKNSLKTKEQISQEENAAAQQQLHDTAEFIYSSIKDEIVKKASNGETTNGIIKGIHYIHYFTGSYDDTPVPRGYAYYFNGKVNTGYSRHGGIFRFHDVHHFSVKMNNVEGILTVYNILLGLCKQDGISISQPFLHAVIKEYFGPRVIKETKIPIKNGELQHTIRYDTYISGGKTTGESGCIYLAVEYEYRV